ncbi:MAG TPA: molybdate ABC transporter substrate-binding protein [Candidatus Polarisedimenticolia bacterium]|nr:molybdate ABC transporter substrate-binding protein [Candidatus Polarisedimenticolia bacterium]
MRSYRRIAAFLLPAALAGGLGAAAPKRPIEISVYAAASLRDVLEDLAPRCESQVGIRPVFNFGGSNDLARQIIAAGKADLFLSADEAWMDKVAAAGLVDGSSRLSLLSNRLVVVGPADTAIALQGPADLNQPAIRRLALANPEAVPAGEYARAWLEKAGLWDALQGRIVPSLDVRAALSLVESGAADAGVVYRSDVAISRKVRILYEVPAADGPRISYALAALKGPGDPAAVRRLLAWLTGLEATRAFERYGFVVLAHPS